MHSFFSSCIFKHSITSPRNPKMVSQIIFLIRNPSDGPSNDLFYLKTFFKRDIIHPLHLILSPIPFIAEPDVIFSSCLPLPFISRALSDDLFFPKKVCTVMSVASNIIRLV